MDILVEKLNFFETNQPGEHDPSLLAFYMRQPDLDMKDIIGMMVDILMAGVDTVSKIQYRILNSSYIIIILNLIVTYY